MTKIKTRIIRIGNSKGIRIPKLMLDQANFGKEVELEVEVNQIVIRSSQSSRQGWEEQFIKMTEEGDDVLMDEDLKFSSWDEVDWEW